MDTLLVRLGSDLLVRQEAFDLMVLVQVAEGQTNREIADILCCYEEYVKRSLARSQRQFGTTDRAGSVGAAFRAGVLT